MFHFIHDWIDVKEVCMRTRRHMVVHSHYVYQECRKCGKRRIIDIVPKGSRCRLIDPDWLMKKV